MADEGLLVSEVAALAWILAFLAGLALFASLTGSGAGAFGTGAPVRPAWVLPVALGTGAAVFLLARLGRRAAAGPVHSAPAMESRPSGK